MPENDFQTQLAAVMDILIKAAMRETTKLYETGVLELRIEMAQMKQENESLKSRLRFSERIWRHRGRQEDRHDDITIDSMNQKYQRTEAETGPEDCHGGPWLFPAPPSQANGDEEQEDEDMMVLNHAAVFKEESPEVEFVLIKQEDSDIEEYIPDMPPTQRKRGAEATACRDQLWPTLKNRAVHSASLAPVAMASTSTKGQQTGPGRAHSGRGGSGCKTEQERKQDPLPKKGGQSGKMQGETSGETIIPPSPWATGRGPLEPAAAAPEQQGVGYAPLPSISRSHYGSSYLTEFARVDQQARLHDRASVARQEVDDLSGGGAEHEGAEHEPEGAEYALSHHLLEGWRCGPGDPLCALPSNSRQGQQELSAFQCDQCGRVLSSAMALEAHRSVHTGERPYPCTECSKTFPSLRGLNRHSQVHSAEKQHSCLQCGKSFVYQFSLTKHQLIHSGERAHVCKQCGKSFVFKSDLTIHTRMHTGETPYSCTVCGKQFKHRRALGMHLQGHTGEKRHHCPYCGKSFLDLGNFKRHKRIHTGEKPYSCQLCGKNFTQSAHLKKHILTHK
ncbi:hypothetical protein SKAU_G00032090 [Synaphobranchus kaupii]|uniref:C2H2-type domain-containing protein n=1 Tax=Synaphobranchus kaupii TaxID=118154 RepID=A0A9Q1GF62_SYNKA|nr:hypothetical protein SKAU_G00032090 [Synaphobranchus kaupii]